MNLIFQDFKQALDLELVNRIHPEVFRFLRSIEHKIENHFDAIAGSFQAMLDNLMHHHTALIAKLGNENNVLSIRNHDEKTEHHHPNLYHGLVVPRFHHFTRNSAKLKTEVIFRFGVYTLMGMFRRLIKQPFIHTNKDMVKVLESGIRRLKQDSIKSTTQYLIKYRDHLTSNFVNRRVEKGAEEVYQKISNQYLAHTVDLNGLIATISSDYSVRQTNLKTIGEVESVVKPLTEAIKGMRQQQKPLTNTSTGDI